MALFYFVSDAFIAEEFDLFDALAAVDFEERIIGAPEMVFALDNGLIGDKFVEFDVEELDGPFGLVLLGEGFLVFGQFFVDCAG